MQMDSFKPSVSYISLMHTVYNVHYDQVKKLQQVEISPWKRGGQKIAVEPSYVAHTLANISMSPKKLLFVYISNY